MAMSLPRYLHHDWQPITHGRSGDLVWRLTGPSTLFVKQGSSARDEAARIVWLAAQGVPVPELVDAADDWLVTTAVSGRPAHEAWDERDRAVVVDAIADVIGLLHSINIGSCPFDRTSPDHEDLVVCHGDPSLPNVLIDPHTLAVTGLVDLARLGVADRYVDLAIVTRSMAVHPDNTQFGPAMAQRFLNRYGRPAPDPDKIAFYRLLDEFS